MGRKKKTKKVKKKNFHGYSPILKFKGEDYHTPSMSHLKKSEAKKEAKRKQKAGLKTEIVNRKRKGNKKRYYVYWRE